MKDMERAASRPNWAGSEPAAEDADTRMNPMETEPLPPFVIGAWIGPHRAGNDPQVDAHFRASYDRGSPFIVARPKCSGKLADVVHEPWTLPRGYLPDPIPACLLEWLQGVTSCRGIVMNRYAIRIIRAPYAVAIERAEALYSILQELTAHGR
jgi:hypothetical protein